MKRRLLITLATLAGLAIAADVYTRWPATVTAAHLALRPDTQHLILIIHGSFGREEPTLVALEARLGELTAALPDTQVLRYRWSPWSDNILRADARGTRIGMQLGEQLGTYWRSDRGPGLGAGSGARTVTLHLIAHSAGAYLLDPLCERLRRSLGNSPVRLSIRMTFLDPIGLHGLLQRGWGAEHFGRCADEADAWINTDDPAPATDRWLRHAWNIDVTQAAGHEGFAGGGHRWPVHYYLEQLRPQDLAFTTSPREGRTPGGVERR